MTISASDRRPRYRADDLRSFTAAVFERFGVPPADARLGAEVLIDADLAGIESHGIAHLPWHPGYAPGLRSGIVRPVAEIGIERDSPVAATWDANGGVGVIVAQRAMAACIDKARATGVGTIAVRNSRHFGAAGYYAAMAAREDMVGMALCNVPPIAVAAGSLDRAYGTNPIAMAAPVQDDHSFLLDIATTAVAGGKLEIAMRQGTPIPLGWAVDSQGSDSNDPAIVRKGGALLPLGSRLETSSHKGYGLGIMVDILTGILPGMGSALFTDRSTLAQGQWFAAWRIDAFCDPVQFKADMKQMVDRLRALRPAEGQASVLVPGDPEAAARTERIENGIPLDAETIEQLQSLGDEVGVEFPKPL